MKWGLYRGRAITSNLICLRVSAVCGRAFSRNNTYRQSSSAFALNCRLQHVSNHLPITSTVYCYALLLIIFQYWAFWVPKTISTSDPAELFLAELMRMFPCPLLSGLQWLIHVLLPLLILSRRHIHYHHDPNA